MSVEVESFLLPNIKIKSITALDFTKFLSYCKIWFILLWPVLFMYIMKAYSWKVVTYLFVVFPSDILLWQNFITHAMHPWRYCTLTPRRNNFSSNLYISLSAIPPALLLILSYHSSVKKIRYFATPWIYSVLVMLFFDVGI